MLFSNQFEYTFCIQIVYKVDRCLRMQGNKTAGKTGKLDTR